MYADGYISFRKAWMIKAVLLICFVEPSVLVTVKSISIQSLQDDSRLYIVTPALRSVPKFTVVSVEAKYSERYFNTENYQSLRTAALQDGSIDTNDRQKSLGTDIIDSVIVHPSSLATRSTGESSSDQSQDSIYSTTSTFYSTHISESIMTTLHSSFPITKRKSSVTSTTGFSFSSLVCPSVIIISPVCLNSSYSNVKTSISYISITGSYTTTKTFSTLLSTLSSIASLSHITSPLITSVKTMSTKKSLKTSFARSSSYASFSTMKLHSTRSSLKTFQISSRMATIVPVPSSTSMIPLKTKAIPLNPSIDKCDVVIDDFSNAMTNFTKCVLLNFHPMRVCYNCFVHYDNLLVKHRNVSHSCYDKLISDYNMQYQIVPQMYQSHLNTWQSLGCEKCYDRSLPGILSKDFLTFIKLFDETKECFANFTSATLVNTSIPHNGSTENPVCEHCNVYYQKLQKKFPYYRDDAGDEPGTDWCADINTAVNKTRHLWSGIYDCGKVEKDLEAIIALTCFFCFLPIIFYVGAKLHSDVKERKNADRYNNYYDSD